MVFTGKKKTGCTVANGGVRQKKKLYGGCITQTVRAAEKKKLENLL